MRTRSEFGGEHRRTDVTTQHSYRCGTNHEGSELKGICRRPRPGRSILPTRQGEDQRRLQSDQPPVFGSGIRQGLHSMDHFRVGSTSALKKPTDWRRNQSSSQTRVIIPPAEAPVTARRSSPLWFGARSRKRLLPASPTRPPPTHSTRLERASLCNCGSEVQSTRKEVPLFP